MLPANGCFLIMNLIDCVSGFFFYFLTTKRFYETKDFSKVVWFLGILELETCLVINQSCPHSPKPSLPMSGLKTKIGRQYQILTRCPLRPTKRELVT